MRTIKTDKFMVDGIDPVHDGAGTPFYAIQSVDTKQKNAKVAVVYAERAPGVLTEVLRIPAMIGAPHVVFRPDGTAYVCGGGHEHTIETGYTIPTFVPLVQPSALEARLIALAMRVDALEQVPHE